MSKKFLRLYNTTVKKVLSVSTIQRMFGRSCFGLSIAGMISLPRVSAEEIIIDFKGHPVTEAAISKRLQDENEKKISVCIRLAKKFGQCAEDFRNPLKTLQKASNDDTLDELIERFVAFVSGGEALKPSGKIPYRIPHKDKLSPTEKESADMVECWCETAIRFKCALEMLKDFPEGDETVKNALKALYDAGTACYKAVFLSSFWEMLPGKEEVEEECLQRLGQAETTRANARAVRITLRNGSVDPKTSGQLFKNLRSDLHLTFDRMKGIVSADPVLKERLISLAFVNSELELEEYCFAESKLLENVSFKDSILTMHFLSFSRCGRLKRPKYENLLLYLPPPSNLINVFEEDPYITEEDVREMATDCFRERCGRGMFADEKEAGNYLMCHQLDSILTEFYRRCEIEKRNAELEKQFEVFKEEKKKFEKRISDLKSTNANILNGKETVLQKNRTLKAELAEQKEALRSKSDQCSRLSEEYESFKKQQTETVEKIMKELEETRRDRDLRRAELSEVLETGRKLREELKTLRSENEAQAEKIAEFESLTEGWKDKINTVTTLEAEKSGLGKRLADATKDKDEAERKLGAERERNKIALKEKKQDIANLKQKTGNFEAELAKTQMLLSEARAKIKELENSETCVLKTMDIISVKEDDKKEIQPNDFRPIKNDKKPFFPKKKSKKGGKYVEFDIRGANF